ncbi:MAG: hypothetical protein RI554_06930 [Trueperaceae bacterium]|nr:hypothetical protein [Trueperaceae bacterium]
MTRSVPWLRIATLLFALGILAGCNKLSGGANNVPPPVDSTVTLCTASVPQPDDTERDCDDVAFTYEAPTLD